MDALVLVQEMFFVVYDLAHRYIFTVSKDSPWHISIAEFLMIKDYIWVPNMFIFVVFELFAILADPMLTTKFIPQWISHSHTTTSNSNAYDLSHIYYL